MNSNPRTQLFNTNRSIMSDNSVPAKIIIKYKGDISGFNLRCAQFQTTVAVTGGFRFHQSHDHVQLFRLESYTPQNWQELERILNKECKEKEIKGDEQRWVFKSDTCNKTSWWYTVIGSVAMTGQDVWVWIPLNPLILPYHIAHVELRLPHAV